MFVMGASVVCYEGVCYGASDVFYGAVLGVRVRA